MAFVCNANYPMKLFQKTYVQISSLQQFFSPPQAKRLGDKTKIILRSVSQILTSITLVNLPMVFFIFFYVPHLAASIFLFFNNEPQLSAKINPVMALTTFPSSILDEKKFEPATF